jgi:hypothetical protein
LKSSLALACAIALLAASPAHAAAGAVLRGLDKISGQARDFTAPIGKVTKFGTLEITVRACQKAAAEETPEVSVYIEVVDVPVPRTKDDSPERKPIKSGWIFASNPARNALEHPTYDVWAIDCRS